MRRVYDDKHYEEISEQISKVLFDIPGDEVSEYDYCIYRAQVRLVREYIAKRVPVKFGRNEHAYGIGNNNSYEIIVTDGDEEQICGLLHLTKDLYGGVIAWTTDIDEKRKGYRRRIYGCNPKCEYDMRVNRFRGRNGD